MAREYDYPRPKGANLFFLLIYLLVGLYFVNYPFGLVSIPEQVSSYDQWIIFAGGILIMLGALNYFRIKRR
jgi:Mg2+ and Co2+ transporter CorA